MWIMCISGISAHAQAPLVSLENGTLVYNYYANRGQQNAVNRIPDFSNSGYKGGGVPLPELAVRETLQPIAGDNRVHIQAAIDRVSALSPDQNGFRGAVLLKAGIYPVEGSLSIATSGVVLRGEGTGLNGTVLIATQKAQHNFITIAGSGSGFGEVPGSRSKISSPYVATGARSFEVVGHTFQPGDRIVVQKTPTEEWIDVLDMRQYGWTASSYRLTYERQVTAVSGSTITIDIPIMDPMEDLYGGGDVYKSNIIGRVSESGVENLRIESFYATDGDESHGWNAVVLNRAQNCWVKDVVAKFFGYAAVNVTNMSRFNTIQDCAMIDPKSVTTGGRKYSFNIDGNSTSNLFQRCMTWGGRHDLVSGSKVPGPNVFLDCVSENTFADIGPHHRWSTGQLYDNVYGGQIRVQNRGSSGSGHGWAGAQTLFWNCDSYKSDIEVESPPTAINWGIGCIGQNQTNAGYWESWGTHVLPRSLYLQQLQERLGPQAVVHVTIPDQLQNTLREKLKKRIGDLVAEKRAYYTPPPGDEEAFDITNNGGTITSQFASNKANENFPNIMDNKISTKYYQNGKKALWVQYQSTVAAIVTRYTITSANDVPDRDPKDWTLAGSNNGTTWTVLDTRKDEDFPTRFLTRTFNIDNTEPFVFYRLSILQNSGNNNTQFAEWELFQRKMQSIIIGEIGEKTFGDEPFEITASASSELPVTIELVSGPVSFDEGFITIHGAGTVVLRITQEGNDDYFPATLEKTFVINKARQSITFAALPPSNKESILTLHAECSSGLPVAFEVVSGPAEMDGESLSFSGEGEVVVQAVQPGNENYLPAEPVAQTILVFADDAQKDGILLIVHPNPTKGKIKVKLENRKDKQYSFAVYDSYGMLVGSAVVAKSHKMFDLDFDLEGSMDGLYYLWVSDGSQTVVRRIIKE